jgi:phospholipase C
VPTVFDELHAKGLPWRIYGAGVPGGGPDTTAGGYIWSVCPTFAECLYTSQVKNLVPTAQFFTDAAAGNLPAYSVIAPGAGYASDAEHNKQSMAKGDNFLGQVASAMENSPDWGSTIMIITYDDFGGFYANPSPAPGTGPDGTRQGFRLPVVIVSPFARPGYVDTTRASQASITALVEHTFGLAPLGLNDQNAYAYGNALCLPPSCTQAHARPVKMIRRPLPASARHLGNAGTYADS